MSRGYNTAHLRKAVADRRNAATHRTIAAIAELDRTGTTVTIAGVAHAAGVSRSWLYEQADLLADITRLRNQTPNRTPIPITQRTSDDSLRQRLDTARAEIARLRTENTILRNQLACALGEQRIRR